MRTQSIETPDALKIIGMSSGLWRDLVDQGNYTCAPRTIDGRRAWTIDELVCLSWADALITSGMKQPMAGACAAGLADAMQRHKQARSFNVYAIERDGERGELIFCADASHDPAAQHVFTVPVAQWRAKIRKARDNFYRRKAVRNAR